MNSIPEKQCTKCGEKKPATDQYFTRKKKAKDGLNWICKHCGKQQTANWREDHRNEARLYSRQWALANPERKRELNKMSIRKCRAINPEKFRQQSQQRYHADIELSRKRLRDARKANPERARAHKSKRRALELNAPGNYTSDDIKALRKSQKGLCWWCEQKLSDEYHIDHRVALSRGGSNWPNNLCLTCKTCNLKKSNKLPSEWNGRLL